MDKIKRLKESFISYQELKEFKKNMRLKEKKFSNKNG